MREKAERLSRAAAHYDKGAEGERATAAALAALPADSWTVFHDLRWPGRRFANVDHVVVGPPGVFVIDSKNWSGRIDVQYDALRLNGRRREPAVNGVAEAALAVAGLTRAVPPTQVFPVLCFAREEPVTGWTRDVMLCSLSNVVQMLTTRPAVLDEASRRMTCLELDAALRSATAPEPRRPVNARPRRAATPAARRTKKSSGLARLLAVVVGVAVALAVLVVPASKILGEFVQQIAASEADADQPEPRRDLDRRSVLGRWSGDYTCGGNVAAGRLVIQPVEGSPSKVRAVFGFGPSAEDAALAEGSYRLTGTYRDGVLTLRPGKWIERPPGYTAIGFEAAVAAEDPDVLTGRIPECAGFELTRERGKG